MGKLESVSKYKFEGIGEASAVVTLAALAAYPNLAPVATGAIGKITFFILKIFYMGLASIGLVVLNVGIADVQVMSQQKEFDGTFDEAAKLIRAGNLTKEQRDAIDAKVMAAFRKFASLGNK